MADRTYLSNQRRGPAYLRHQAKKKAKPESASSGSLHSALELRVFAAMDENPFYKPKPEEEEIAASWSAETTKVAFLFNPTNTHWTFVVADVSGGTKTIALYDPLPGGHEDRLARVNSLGPFMELTGLYHAPFAGDWAVEISSGEIDLQSDTACGLFVVAGIRRLLVGDPVVIDHPNPRKYGLKLREHFLRELYFAMAGCTTASDRWVRGGSSFAAVRCSSCPTCEPVMPKTQDHEAQDRKNDPGKRNGKSKPSKEKGKSKPDKEKGKSRPGKEKDKRPGSDADGRSDSDSDYRPDNNTERQEDDDLQGRKSSRKSGRPSTACVLPHQEKAMYA
ncbi:hypothetical protein BCR34DRAFT_607803 [Clohesyomyces aquaticus]|uniref:Ubiquitin-like protease family profile domain-containing protein n=1 Tax=Clohesyomyces aquaticus TaxID=1231657 RepID=A0A1Y1YD61_9PLEO|nr:hypothetical protein BCR34DRAFT_607803 [Clohesyomyces aquaticus]